ncbi:acyl-CoA dehydrogenase family protein [Agrobacterium leguminum]|uniref:Acyl-CoA dehydrogenase n=1 Tax=Agrobacterium deltaense NCPPB 1641 TaxID=1183425 RepID=A0A1S7U064_9HYPH|nr:MULTISPECIES: acyl-CoA dehydrogenase family protein [Agrobacterium]WFS67685.1 acyl-CoA dehydrogenase family protein [Agrobacterium leguminum]CVI60229.1 Acyl-CoA dehydrogenase [Agrobacterium deltaense NCPPB 1641]
MSVAFSAVANAPAQRPDPVAVATALAGDFSLTAADHDKSGEFAAGNFGALFKSGLLGLVTAEKDGGWGEGMETAHAVITAIARGDPSTALILAMHYSVHAAIRRGKWPAALAAKVLAANSREPALLNNAQAEPGVGSPAHGGLPETTARIEGDVWVVNGRKSFVTGLPGLKWAIVLAVTTEETPRLIQLLVPLDAAGIAQEKAWEATGMYATASHDLVLENVQVPLADIVAEQPADEPLRRDEEDGYNFFVLLASVYHGVALSARDDLLRHLNGHVPASLGAPLSSIPRIQEGLGQIEVLLAANRRLLLSVARDVDAGERVGTDALAVRHVVIDNAVTVTDLALELGGNRGLRRDYDLERHHRDAITARAHAPQSHMIRTILGRQSIKAAGG